MLTDTIHLHETPIVRPIMPELDSLRGIAVLMVCVYHGFEVLLPSSPAMPTSERAFLSIASLGWTGVNLFFALSGFLITGILIDSSFRPRYYARFYSRRAMRILPAYYLLIAVLLLVSHLGFVTHHTSWAFAGLSLVYLSNITPLLGVARDYQPLWSLAVEEHFYLVWPAAVKRLSRRGLATMAVAICVSQPFIRAFAIARGGLWWGPYTWVSADGLALGALLAIFARSRWSSRKNLLRFAIISTLVAIIGLIASIFTPRFLSIALRGTCVNYGAVSLLAFALWFGTGASQKFIGLRILSFYGFISYGLYLVHTLVLNMYSDLTMKFLPALVPGLNFKTCLLQVIVTIAIATGIAWISRTTFEKFFLELAS
jgi:peptidoglycan/LPS O-acetylase OafA/YrhL